MRTPSLQSVLYANVTFSAACAVTMLVATDPLVRNVMMVPPLVFQLLGVGLLGFALFVFMVARQKPLSRNLVMSIFVADLGWVLATPILLLAMAERIPASGNIFIVEIALVVAVLAVLEWRGLKAVGADPACEGIQRQVE